MGGVVAGPPEYTQKDALGLEILYSGDETKVNIDIIAVHGLNGGALSTWSKLPAKDAKPCCWIRDLLPSISTTDMCPRIMSFGYNARIWSKTAKQTIYTVSSELLTQLVDCRKGIEDNRSILFIAHTMGGLVVKSCLLLSRSSRDASPDFDIQRSTLAVVLFGTPHSGSKLAVVGSIASNLSSLVQGNASVEYFKGLKINSAMQQHLNQYSEFQDRYRQHDFIESKAEHAGKRVVDGSITKHRTLNMSTSFLDANHTDMARFTGPRVPNWRSASEKIHSILCAIDINLGSQQAVNTAPAICDLLFERKDKLHQIDKLLASSIDENARVAIISSKMLATLHLGRSPSTTTITLDIKPFSLAESLSFCRGILTAKGYTREISKVSISSISASCENLPLLLAIVARHIAARDLEDCSLDRKQIMDIISLSSPEASLKHSTEDLDSCARHLLRLLSFLDSQGVSSSLIILGTASTPSFVDCDGNSWLYVEKQAEKDLRQHLDTAVDIFKTKGFLKSDRLCLHPVVQDKALESMSVEERVNIWSWAITLIFKLTPKQQGGIPLSKYWKGVSQWLPHIQHLLQQWKNDHELSTEDRKLSDNPLLLEIGRIWAWMLYEQGRLLEAQDIIDTPLHLLKCIQQRSPNLKVSATATLAHEGNQHQTALDEMRVSKSLRESVHASNRDLVDSDTNIAVALIMMEDSTDEATNLLKAGLAYANRHRDDKVMQLLEPKYHANLALCLLLQSRLLEALDEVHISLKGEKDALEKARVYFTLGKIQLATYNANHPEALYLAEAAFQKCWDLRQRHSGTHYLVGYTLHKLGEVFIMRACLEEASTYFQLAAQSFRQAQGQIPNGPLIRTLWAWSAALYSQEKVEQAGSIRQEALNLIRHSDQVLRGADGKAEFRVADLTLEQCQTRAGRGEFEQWVPFPHR
ncbi:uncharacterized protein LY89DRAFT_730072 [Mollisia scopiformis]|uniref:DUF676 domain-containing protein n=1 Tax=Mollisia scopiformis TaxID=149040 RepID=A0A194XMD5_MOLSC|nr:uncharacterized protein LY89DRAFT_730072 [Mollisia scopiformis]KUJ21286.1 hypothetical protein LY89DRAFT_730072 [Mollisia scopiformis]